MVLQDTMQFLQVHNYWCSEQVIFSAFTIMNKNAQTMTFANSESVHFCQYTKIMENFCRDLCGIIL